MAGMVWKAYIRQHPRFGGWYTRVERQPSWAVKSAVIAGVLVVVVPLVLLTLAAIAVAAAVFVVSSLIAWVLGLFGHPLREPTVRDDGRDNVRVIDAP